MNELATNLISFLTSKNDFVDSTELAAHFNVSTKTIYRTIKDINQHQELISSQRGLGYRIEDSTIETLVPIVRERRSYAMAIYLLFHHPRQVTFTNLANRFYVSDSTVSSELHMINSDLAAYHVCLIRKRGRVEVNGTEQNIRQALNFMLLTQSQNSESFSQIENVFPEINKYDKDFLISQITLIQQELALTLVDPYTINIFSHLYILIRRLRGNGIQSNQVSIPDESEKYPDYYTVARKIIENIANYIGETVPAIEISNLMQYIVSLRYIDSEVDSLLTRNELDVAKYPQETIEFVNHLVASYPFTSPVNQNKLRYDLCAHVQPMLNRVQADVRIVNPLVSDIEANYAQVFELVRKLTDAYQLSNGQPVLSNDEIGFLAIYIERAIEERPQRKNVLIMCSTGIGTAQLLRTKVQNLFTAINIVDVLSSFEYLNNQQKYNHNVDLIISTVAIPGETLVPVVVISPLPSDVDIRRIEAYLHA